MVNSSGGDQKIQVVKGGLAQSFSGSQ